jgi:hypothetical protein
MSDENKILETCKIKNEEIRKIAEKTIRESCAALRAIGYEVYLDEEGGVTVTNAYKEEELRNK